MKETIKILGNYFEDFRLNQRFEHGVPRTITGSDATLYLALTGNRYALHCAETIAKQVGFKTTPIDNLLLFNIAFGKTVNDISLNAVANLGYAECMFHHPVYPGDTIMVGSQIIGLRENKSAKTGIVYVHSIATNQQGLQVLSWKRWVMVNKREQSSQFEGELIPTLRNTTKLSPTPLPSQIDFSIWNSNYSDNQFKFDEFNKGNILDHRDGMTINESDHSLATRLYQNNARVHFDQTFMESKETKKRLVYGGHVISIGRTLSYNGLSNAVWITGINAGTHCNPCYSGDTLYAQSVILDKVNLDNQSDFGLLRIQMLIAKNSPFESLDSLYVEKCARRRYSDKVVLDLDYWVVVLK